MFEQQHFIQHAETVENLVAAMDTLERHCETLREEQEPSLNDLQSDPLHSLLSELSRRARLQEFLELAGRVLADWSGSADLINL